MIALAVPWRKPGVGIGYALMIAMPFGESRPSGMTLPGNGWPVSGSRTMRAPLKNPLFGSSSSPKSPRRIRSVGTVMIAVASWKKLTHSCDPKKNSLSLNIPPGIGPPKE